MSSYGMGRGAWGMSQVDQFRVHDLEAEGPGLEMGDYACKYSSLFVEEWQLWYNMIIRGLRWTRPMEGRGSWARVRVRVRVRVSVRVRVLVRHRDRDRDRDRYSFRDRDRNRDRDRDINS